MIKTILKKLFPRTFLKKCFLIYNRLRIQTIDQLIFKEYIPSKEEVILFQNYLPFKDHKEIIYQLKETSEYNYFQKWLEWEQEEYLVHMKQPVIIEPLHGWALIKPNTLIYHSLAFSKTEHQKKPNLFRFLINSKVKTLDKALSLRDSGEENYFHFYNDVMAKIYYTKQLGIRVEDYAIIISARLASKKYFQNYVTGNAFLASLKWVIQDQEYLKCNNIIFCKPPTHQLQLWNNFIYHFPPPDEMLQIFLVRSRTRLRFIENQSEIEEICLQRKFLIIDSDQLSFEQQVEIFSKANIIVGIHGAGLTNMIYAPVKCKVLEIFPPPDAGYLPYHYLLLSAMKKFSYQAISGDYSIQKYSGGFYLHPRKFKDQLDLVLGKKFADG